MNVYTMTFSLVTSVVLLTACANKPFTLQSLVDEHMNDTNSTEVNKERSQTPSDEELGANPALKRGHGARIAGSSVYNKEKQRGQKGAMQESLDSWLEEEWNPAFEGDANQSAKDEEAKEHFKLQHYVDKSAKYLEKKEEEKKKSGKADEPAHYEKLESMPVIGKP